jgi:hypothetical protein
MIEMLIQINPINPSTPIHNIQMENKGVKIINSMGIAWVRKCLMKKKTFMKIKWKWLNH